MFGTSAQEVLLICAQNNLEKDIKQRDKVPVGLKHITVEDNKTKQTLMAQSLAHSPMLLK